jgi:acyl-CoA thioester hydrolase
LKPGSIVALLTYTIMYTKDFQIRWSDLDANRHVANSSYVDLLSETRMSYLRENGFTQTKFEEYGIGPVIFTEEFYYIKEIKPNENIKISVELMANSESFKYIKFAHCIFNDEGKLCVYSETFFGWFSLTERRLVVPPELIKDILSTLQKTDQHEILSENLSLKNPKIPFGKTL